MSKGIAAMSYLPAIDINLDASAGGSIEAIKAICKKVANFQVQETADGTYSGVPVNVGNPYNTVIAEYIVASSGAEITVELTGSAADLQEVGSLGRAALSTRRDLTISTSVSALTFTVRSLLAVLNFVNSLEDKVASTGVSATGDATYTDIVVKGQTPYESYTWTVVKLAADYILTATANS